MANCSNVKSVIFFLFSFVCLTVSAQDELWYFGNYPSGGTGMAFTGSGNAPVQRNGENTKGFYESVSVISDGSGNLRFYTDGLKVYDKNNNVMPNGNGLLGSQEDNNNPTSGSAPQGVLVTNDPTDPDIYFIFTTEDLLNTTKNGFRYSIVDMTLNSGLGDVVSGSKNILLHGGAPATPNAEMIAATTKNCDTTWVVTHSGYNSDFYAYPVSSAGVGTAVVSSVGNPISPNDERRGTLAFSPDGSLLSLSATVNYGSWIFNFDISTGIVTTSTYGTNSDGQVNTVGTYGSEWSPDGEKLYMSSNGAGIRQFNVLTNSTTSVDASATLWGEMVKGKDGNIYIGQWNTSNFLGVISTPNAATGLTCGFNANGWNAGGPVWYGLPQIYINDGPPNSFASIDTTGISSICDTTSAFDLSPRATPIGGFWASIPAGFVTKNGIFDPGLVTGDSLIKIVYGLTSCIDNDTVDIFIMQCCEDIETNAPSGPICPGDSVDLNAMVVAGVGTWSITSSPSGSNLATISSNGQFFETELNTTPGTYTLTYTLSTVLAGCQDTTQETITVITPPSSGLIATDDVCSESSIMLTAGNSSNNYLWSPGGETDSAIVVTTGGTYEVTITNIATGCITIDSTVVTLLTLPSTFSEDTSVCAGGTITLSPGSFVSYEWISLGSSNSTYDATSAGTFEVIVENNDGCKDTITYNVNTGNNLNLAIGADDTICDGVGTTFDALPTNHFVAPLSYAWSTTETTQAITVISSGNYSAEVTDVRNCKGFDTVQIGIFPDPEVSLPDDTTRCFTGNESYTTSVLDTFFSVTWNDGSSDTILTIYSPTTITVTVTNNFGCSDADTMLVSEFCTPTKLTWPNFISTNGDGQNDVFIPFNYDPDNIIEFNIAIYNRWGRKLYNSSTDITWDGTFNGKPVSPATYYWTADYTDSAGNDYVEGGWVQVVR